MSRWLLRSQRNNSQPGDVRLGQKCRFERAPATSAVPPIATKMLSRGERRKGPIAGSCSATLQARHKQNDRLAAISPKFAQALLLGGSESSGVLPLPALAEQDYRAGLRLQMPSCSL